MCASVCVCGTHMHIIKNNFYVHTSWWLQLVGPLKSYVSFVEYRLFHRTLLQKSPITLRSLLILATPYVYIQVLFRLDGLKDIKRIHGINSEKSLIYHPNKPSNCNTLQHAATRCNTLQHAATHCNTLQYIATYCNSRCRAQYITQTNPPTAPHCITLQNTATHCNTLQHTAIHGAEPNISHKRTLQLRHTNELSNCNTLQHTATHCNTLQHTATHCAEPNISLKRILELQHTATHCNTL